MAIVVIGGHSRNIGKTSVMAGLIAALPAYRWTAFKITQSRKSDGPPTRELRGAPRDQCWSITEEQDESGKTDSSRFLRAGAERWGQECPDHTVLPS